MATVKQTLDAIKSVPGMTSTHSDGEWRVVVKIDQIAERFPEKTATWRKEKQEAMAYYTTIADDAVSTAHRISKEWYAGAQQEQGIDGLTKKQQEALDAFRQSNGRYWKSELRKKWERAHYPGVSSDHAASLQQIRNNLGPEWLAKYREPASKAPQRERAYDFKSGFRQKAEDLFGWLQYEGLEPQWETYQSSLGEQRLAITVDVNQKDRLSELKMSKPNRFDVSDGPAINYFVLDIDETGNSAFVESGREQEVARIMSELAAKIADEPDVIAACSDRPVWDFNGNKVGKTEMVARLSDEEVRAGSVRVTIDLGNDAFADRNAGHEISRILQLAAQKVQGNKKNFFLHDFNGNKVGEVVVAEPPSLQNDGVIDMKKALFDGRVYAADGIEEDEYRYVVTTPEFEPGYGQGRGDVWLVNAKGEIAYDYRYTETVDENSLRELKRSEIAELDDVVEGRVSYEEFVSRFNNDPEDSPEP